MNNIKDEIKFLDLQRVTAMHGDEIASAVERVVRRGWYLLGEEVGRFEESYSRFIGTKHCIGCGNGLDALRLIIMAYKELGVLHEGDEIIVPANTYIATILSITENRLKPVLVEPRADTLQLDSRLIESAITRRTKAIMLVHLYGKCAYDEQIERIARRFGLMVLEDNAQAHGCEYNRRRTGSLGEAAAHSFYPGKNLGALGDGGAVTTDSDALAEAVRALANYGSERKYVLRYQGINSRLDELQAAVLSVKLKYLEADNDHRRQVAHLYNISIDNPLISIPNKTTTLSAAESRDNVYHIYPILTDLRDPLQQWLGARGVQTLIHYPIPPHKQQCYAEWNAMSLPVSESIAQRELSLPMSPYLSQEEAMRVIDSINAFRR